MPRLTPRTVKKLKEKARAEVADHGVFCVQRITYEELPRDIFVFTCPDWCNVLAETVDGDILFVWQYRFGTDAVSLEIPGGVIDAGETPESAARRELREETGYDADSFELVSVVEPNPALQGNRCYTFFARGARPVGPTAFDELEDLELELVPKGDVASLIDDGVVTHALVITALEAYVRRFRR